MVSVIRKSPQSLDLLMQCELALDARVQVVCMHHLISAFYPVPVRGDNTTGIC